MSLFPAKLSSTYATMPYPIRVNFRVQHVVKATRAGYISGLRVSAGQQVSDGTLLFTVKVSINLLLINIFNILGMF